MKKTEWLISAIISFVLAALAIFELSKLMGG